MKIFRFPKTHNKSFQAWNAADKLLLNYIEDNSLSKKTITIFNDRFGFLLCNLHENNPIAIINNSSQAEAIKRNLVLNNLELTDGNFQNPLSELPKKIKTAILKTPKSMELYRLYLEQICNNSEPETIVVAGFMTKYFGPQMLDIASEYFSNVSQSKAHKKARLIIMKDKKPFNKSSLIQNINTSSGEIIQQYYGVFSSQRIDFATQFLIENIPYNEQEINILDLASGNGIIAHSVNSYYKTQNWQSPTIHLLDDSFLAIESSKLNLDGDNINFHYGYDFSDFEDNSLDLIISNPPFHFEHEINIEISLGLFQQANKALKANGRLLLVYNQHLNYKSQLQTIFEKTMIVKQNNKFVILECTKS